MKKLIFVLGIVLSTMACTDEEYQQYVARQKAHLEESIRTCVEMGGTPILENTGFAVMRLDKCVLHPSLDQLIEGLEK